MQRCVNFNERRLFIMNIPCDYKAEQSECPYFAISSDTFECGFFRKGICISYRRQCALNKRDTSIDTISNPLSDTVGDTERCPTTKGVRGNIYDIIATLPFEEREKTANDFFISTVYGDATHCPLCGSSHLTVYYKTIYCLGCRTPVCWRKNTIFHKTRMSMLTWFYIIRRIYKDPKVTSVQLSREYNCTQYSAWRMKQKVIAALHKGELNWIVKEFGEVVIPEKK